MTDPDTAVLATALAITTAAAGDTSRSDLAALTVRHLHRLVGGAAVALFVRQVARRYALLAVAGPRARTVRRSWGSGYSLSFRRCPALPALPRTGTPCCIPLRVRRRLIGLIVWVPSKGHCSRDGLQALDRVAAHIAGPLDHGLVTAELAEAAQTVAQSTDFDGVLKAILAGIRRVVPAEATGILVREGANARVVAVDGHPPEAVGAVLPIAGNPSLEGPLLRGEPILQADLGCNDPDAPAGAARIRGHIGVPLLAGHTVIGVLCLDSWRRGAFDTEDLRRAKQFALYVGSAVAGARTHALTQAEADALRHAATLATHAIDGNIMTRILGGLRSIVACDGAGVLLADGNDARVAAAYGYVSSMVGERFPIAGRPSLEHPLREGRSFLTDDLSQEPGYVSVPGVAPVRGHLSVPLIADSVVMGALTVDSQRRGAFGPEDLARVELFAGYVAAALANVRLHEEIKRAAERDSVTNLYNHRAIHAHLERLLAEARAADEPLSVAMLDLDGFKAFNDTYGHPVGDLALQAVASALASACRPRDLVGRYGGDEFLVILPCCGPSDAQAIANRLAQAVAARTVEPVGGHAFSVAISVGTASYPDDAVDRDVLVARADARLYERKHQRGCRSSDRDVA